MRMVNLKDDDQEMDTSPRGSSAIHPLLIDHVVKKILEYAEESDRKQGEGYSSGHGFISNRSSSSPNLLSCRLVCRLWNEIAASLYKSKQQVEVGSYSTSVPKFRRLIKLRKNDPRRRNARKMKTRDDCSSSAVWPCLFTKFRLCQEVFQPIYAPVITDFFQTFHETLEVLDIWLDLRSTLVDVPLFHNNASNKTRCTSTRLFPNMKTLVYDDRRVVVKGSEDVRGKLLRNVIELAPNLKQLSIRFQRDFRGSVECGSDAVLTNISSIFQQYKQLQRSLKFLKLDMHVHDALLACLECANLRVESLEIAIRGSAFTFLAFRQFLESVQPYLKKLKLSYIERDSSCLISFPKMNALCELEIDGTDAFSKHSVAFGDFTYIDNLPQLQALRVNIWATVNLRWSQFFQQRKPPVWHLTELKLPGELCDRGMMSTAALVFPNLKKLHISVYSLTLNAMEVIFESMINLEELTVMKFPSLWDRNERSIDPILTGISPCHCDRLWKDGVSLNKITDDQLAELKGRAGLIDLKNLKKLAMPDLQYQATYTDISGYLAFLKMPNLKHLNVGRSCLSSSCLTQLVTKYPEMEAQRRIPPTYYKEPEDDDDASFLELPGDTCVYL